MTRSIIAAACASSSSPCLPRARSPAQDKPPLIVGAIYVGSVNDYGYNRVHEGRSR